MRVALALPGVPAATTEVVEFYRSDRTILSRLGPTTVISSVRRLPRDVDVVFSWWWDRSLPTAMRARGEAGVPIVVTGATEIGNPVGLSVPRAAAKNCAARACAALAARNVAISSTEEERLLRWRYPRLDVVPLAVDLDFYAPAPNRERDPHMLLTILHLNTRSVRRKGLLRAMEGLALVRDPRCTLVVVGSDQGAVSEVRARAEQLGIVDRMVLAGAVQREEKRRLLAQAGAYVQLSSYEGFGYSVAEAMASGCPVIASGAGALREITGGNAYAYVDDRFEFATAVDGMAMDADGLQVSASHCLAHCQEEFSYEVRQHRLQAIFEAVMR